MNITQERYRRAKEFIPVGVGLISKRPEAFSPGHWPAYHSKAKGCEVWDLDGKHYYDFESNGIGACLLGFSYDPVNEAVMRRIRDGSMCTQNPVEEAELAELLCHIHPWASKVRFARGGGEIASVAARIARATTGKDVIAVCGYHGWTDFYLAANLGETPDQWGKVLGGFPPAGVPENLRGTAACFHFDNTEEFDKMIAQYGDRLACVMIETARSTDPAPGFMEHIRAETKRIGALMILDEITIGWRNNFGGYHLKLGITPDMAIFGKCLGNGHPISAVIGTAEAMEGAEQAFISSTYWTESVGPTAALTVLKEMERTKVWEHVWKIGEQFTDILKAAAQKYDIKMDVGNSFPTLNRYSFMENGSQMSTLYTTLMLDQGILAAHSFYPTLAHNDRSLSAFATAVDVVFDQMRDILRRGDLDKVVKEICESDFERLVK